EHVRLAQPAGEQPRLPSVPESALSRCKVCVMISGSHRLWFAARSLRRILQLMRTPRVAMACSPLFLCLTMGATDCQFFSNTTVPDVDTQPPTTVNAVWANGNYVVVVANSDVFTYDLALGTVAVAVASAVDDGGVSTVTMTINEQQ